MANRIPGDWAQDPARDGYRLKPWGVILVDHTILQDVDRLRRGLEAERKGLLKDLDKYIREQGDLLIAAVEAPRG